MKKLLVLLIIITAITCKDDTEEINKPKYQKLGNLDIKDKKGDNIANYDFKKAEINESSSLKIYLKLSEGTSSKVKLKFEGKDKTDFKINKKEITLKKNEDQQLTISFSPLTKGKKQIKLVATLENGNTMNIKLEGVGTDFKTNPIIEAGDRFLDALNDPSWSGKNEYKLDLNGDGEITISEANKYKGHLWFFFSHEIKDFKPLKYFPNITEINIDIPKDADISELDFSKFKNLNTIDLRTEQAFELNFPKNIENLELESYKEFKIKKIDLSNYKKLKTLTIYRSGLQSIDLSKNILLEKIDFSHNNIVSLDLSTLSNLKVIRLGFNENLNSLTLPTNPTSIKEIDLERSYSFSEFNCSNMSNLEKLNLGSNYRINSIIGMGTSMKELNIQYNPISKLNLELPNLEYLNIRGTKIEELNFTNTPKIKELIVHNAPIKTNLIGFKDLSKLEFVNVSHYDHLDFSKMPDLKQATFKEIITLDLSSNNKLEFVDIESQKIESLNLANGNNKKMIATLMLGSLIKCIKIDKDFDPSTANTGFQWSLTATNGNFKTKCD